MISILFVNLGNPFKALKAWAFFLSLVKSYIRRQIFIPFFLLYSEHGVKFPGVLLIPFGRGIWGELCIDLKAICGAQEKDVSIALSVMLHFSSTQLMTRSSWYTNRMQGEHIRPFAVIQTWYHLNAVLHGHNLSGGVARHDVTDGCSLMWLCTVVTRDFSDVDIKEDGALHVVSCLVCDVTVS